MKLVSWILGIILALVVIGAVWYALTPKPASAPAQNAQSGNQNPFGQSSGYVSATTTTAAGSSGSLMIAPASGAAIAVPDFTKTNQPPGADAASGYQVAGSDTSSFQILYYPGNSGFLVSLLSEPLGAARTAAEAALRATLKLSDAQLCSLTVDVRTSADVNSVYAGRNLGLSFCPGATKLPQ